MKRYLWFTFLLIPASTMLAQTSPAVSPKVWQAFENEINGDDPST